MHRIRLIKALAIAVGTLLLVTAPGSAGVLPGIMRAASAVVGATSDQVINNVLTNFAIPRVTYESEVGNKEKVGQRSFTFNNSLRAPDGNNYVVLTDINTPGCLTALQNLAQVHGGTVVQFGDLRQLVNDPQQRQQLVQTLRRNRTGYLAIAPRFENYSENVVLAVWQVLAELGRGSINVYPGFLVAPNEQSFVNLVNGNIQAFTAPPRSPLNPVVVAQSVDQSKGGLRAVEKAQLVEVLFQQLGAPTNGFVVRDVSAPPRAFPKVGNLGTLDVAPDGLLHELPPPIAQAVADSRLVVLFGHGSPGMSCSMDVQSFANIPLTNHAILCGSCFSATPVYSDFTNKPRQREPFFLRAVQSGAPIFYGHMRTNGGFPQLFVVLQALIDGESIGQGYQRLLNAMIVKTRVPPNQFILSPQQIANPNATDARNDLLFMMIGDPAVRPLAG